MIAFYFIFFSLIRIIELPIEIKCKLRDENVYFSSINIFNNKTKRLKTICNFLIFYERYHLRRFVVI